MMNAEGETPNISDATNIPADTNPVVADVNPDILKVEEVCYLWYF